MKSKRERCCGVPRLSFAEQLAGNLTVSELVEVLGPVRMNLDSNSDLDALVARLADGDRSAFTPAFQILWPRVRDLCRNMLKNEADAADAAQQAMEKVLTRSAEYDRQRPALPWALAIAAWECRTALRKRVRRREVSDEFVPDASSERSDDDFAQRQLVQRAVDVMGQLSAVDRETLLATFLDEASSASGATLRKRRERALSRLREAFKRLYGL
jgi:RNA polymerase sigma-70 factor (ECF subfamily)